MLFRRPSVRFGVWIWLAGPCCVKHVKGKVRMELLLYHGAWLGCNQSTRVGSRRVSIIASCFCRNLRFHGGPLENSVPSQFLMDTCWIGVGWIGKVCGWDLLVSREVLSYFFVFNFGKVFVCKEYRYPKKVG